MARTRTCCASSTNCATRPGLPVPLGHLPAAVRAASSEDSTEASPTPTTSRAARPASGTIDGEVVKTQGERIIADLLFLNGVTYEYERPYSHDVADDDALAVPARLLLPRRSTSGTSTGRSTARQPPAEFDGYARDMAWKKATAPPARYDAHRDDLGRDPRQRRVRAAPRPAHRPRARLRLEPGPALSDARPPKHEDSPAGPHLHDAREVELVATAPGPRAERWAQLAPSLPAQVFLDLYWPIHEAWQRRLAEEQRPSTSRTCSSRRPTTSRPARDMAVRPGHGRRVPGRQPGPRPARTRLVGRPGRYLLAVGDDWQSINRFAGADISVMTDFDGWFGEGLTLR